MAIRFFVFFFLELDEKLADGRIRACLLHLGRDGGKERETRESL